MHMRWRAVVGIWAGTDRLEFESSRGVGSSPAAQPPRKPWLLAVEAGIICVVRKHDRAGLWRDAIGSDHEPGNHERRAGFRGGRDPAVLRERRRAMGLSVLPTAEPVLVHPGGLSWHKR